MKKQIVSVLLALCIVLALLPSGRTAEFEPNPVAEPAEDVGTATEEGGIMTPTAADDYTPPVVTSVFMNTPGGAVKRGDTLYFDVKVEDDSPIKIAQLTFSLTETQGTNYIYAYLESYDSETQIAKVSLPIGDNIANGTWNLVYVIVTDYYGNSVSNYPKDPNNPYDTGNPGSIDFDSIQFSVTDISDDATAPTVTSVSMNNPGQVVSVGDTLYFDVKVEDDSPIKITQLTFSLTEAQGTNYIYAYFESYDSETQIAKVSLPIEDNIANGTWNLVRIMVTDYYGNSVSNYPKDPNNPYDTSNPGSVDFDSIRFTVASNDVLPSKVMIEPNTITVPVRSVYTITPTVEPATSVPKWTWTSADTGVATVTISGNGKTCDVTSVAPGTTTITGTTQNGLTASCEVIVTDAPLPESGSINETYAISVGGFVDIVPVLTPSDATTLYEVSSNNPHVASIGLTNGSSTVRVEGVNPGTATITIRGSNNLVMTTTVTVGGPNDTPHEQRIIAGYPATCNQAGRTDRVVCSVCWYVFTEAKELPATGEHIFGDWQVVQEATATVAGLQERYCEICWERVTEVIPATGSTPNVPDSPNGSNISGNFGISGSDTGSSVGPNLSSTNQSENITAGNQNVPVTVKDSTVEMSATEEQIADMIANSATSGIVGIDMSSVADATEIYLPQNVVSSISNSEDVSGLSIAAQSGSIEMSSDALNTVSTALTGNYDQVAIKIETIDVNAIPSTQKYPIANVLNSAVFVELSANVIHKDEQGRTISTEPIREFNGNVMVTVPYAQPVNMEGRQIIACHIADDGTITYFPVKYENGMASFTTTHFSTFAVLESRAAAFRDVDISAWYMLSVEYVLDNRLMNGYDDNLFAPNSNLSRAMLAQIFYNREGKPVTSNNGTFTDVSTDDWYSDAVAWTGSKGIVGGYGNGLFGPNDNITREQLAVMLWRYAGEPAAMTKGLYFTDVDTASSYALDALCWAVENGIISGKGNDILDPKGIATRAQVAQMLKNYLQQDN